jgi:hypothetical protein
MPLVILGIIVVVGACLMIYYQIGPTLKGRTRNAGGTVSSRSSSRDAFGGYIHVDVFPEFVSHADSDLDIDLDLDSDADLEKPFDKNEDGKVLYIFNGGKTELRPLDEAADTPKPPGEDGVSKENPNYPDDDNVG